MAQSLGVGIVGCGFVAHFYARNAASHPDLQIRGAFDTDAEQSGRFCQFFSMPGYRSLQEMLDDPAVALVLNLTNPRSHFLVTKACLEAGKHVYSEKPLGMTGEEARELARIALERGLRLSCAPCSLFSDTAQTLWKAIADGAIGKVRLVYANYDDGMIAPVESPWTWKVDSGAHWPAKDEFEVGCTYEHAGYFLTWLAAFFGPAKRVHAFSSCLLADKGIEVDRMAPDFSTGCIEYQDGVVARVTCGLVAPRDKSMTVIGDEGTLYVRYLRNDSEPVYWRKHKLSTNETRVESRLKRFVERYRTHLERLPWPIVEPQLYRKYPSIQRTSFVAAGKGKTVDFMRGPQEMADAIREQRPHRLSAELAIHIVDLVEALQYPASGAAIQEIGSQFEPIRPLLTTS